MGNWHGSVIIGLLERAFWSAEELLSSKMTQKLLFPALVDSAKSFAGVELSHKNHLPANDA
jgi:hypothetical protein